MMLTQLIQQSASFVIMSTQKFKFDSLFFRRSWHLHKIIFSCGSRNNAYFVLVLVLEICEQLVGYGVGMVTGRYYKVLEEKDMEGFLDCTLNREGSHFYLHFSPALFAY